MKFPFSTYIAGVKYHYKPSFSPSFPGFVKAEKTNPYDSNAIGVYTETNELVGYIPKDDTSLLRKWAESDLVDSLRCDIHLDISGQYNIFRGDVTIAPPSDDAYKHGAFAGSKIYLTPSSSGKINKYIIEFYGATRDARLSQGTDYVILEGDPTEQIKKKMVDERYHFKIIPPREFLLKAIPKDKINADLYDKTVSPATVRESRISDFLKDYLFMEGAIYRERYNKTETDVVVQWDANPTAVVERAIKDGKTIKTCSELMPQVYNELSRLTSSGTANQAASSNHTVYNITADQRRTTSTQRRNSYQTPRSSGCMVVGFIAICAIVGLIASRLLI